MTTTMRPLEEPLLEHTAQEDDNKGQAQAHVPSEGLQLQTHSGSDPLETSQNPPSAEQHHHHLPSSTNQQQHLPSSTNQQQQPIPPPPPLPAAANNGNNGNVEDEQETQRRQNNRLNESYTMLSPFQGSLLATMLLHGVTFRALSHLGVFQSYLFHFGGYSHFLLITDFIRMLICLAVEAASSSGSSSLRQSLRLNFYQHPKDACKMAIVVLLQWAQGQALKQVAQDLDMAYMGLANYGILVGVVLFSVLLLRYSYTRKQWICVAVAFLGCTLATWANLGQPVERHVLDGFFFSLLSLCCGALSLVYTEVVMKQDLRLLRADPPPASVWIRALQYSIWSSIVHMFQGGLVYSGESALLNGWTWFFAPAWAVGPILTMLLTKFVTALHCKLVVYVTMVVSWMISMWFFGMQPTSLLRMYVGSLAVLVSIYLFGMELPKLRDLNNYYARVAMSETETSAASTIAAANVPLATTTTASAGTTTSAV